jgi:hypothetical protein
MAEYTIKETIFTLAELYDENKMEAIFDKLYEKLPERDRGILDYIPEPKHPLKIAAFALLKKQGTQRNSKGTNAITMDITVIIDAKHVKNSSNIPNTPAKSRVQRDIKVALDIQLLKEGIGAICGPKASLRGFSKALSLTLSKEIAEDVAILSAPGCIVNHEDRRALHFPGGNLQRRLGRFFSSYHDKYFLTDALADEFYPDKIAKKLETYIARRNRKSVQFV